MTSLKRAIAGLLCLLISPLAGVCDPQSGAQFCARCHSAQGFAEYVKMLMNGASGRYDYLREIAFDYAFLLSELNILS